MIVFQKSNKIRSIREAINKNESLKICNQAILAKEKDQYLGDFYVGVAHINAQLFPFVLLSGVRCPDFLVTDSFTRGLSGSKERNVGALENVCPWGKKVVGAVEKV